MTIKEFHAQRINKIKYTITDKPFDTVADFYNDFLVSGTRLPDKEIVEKWHDLLVKYVSDPENNIFLVRKYEAGKENNEWNNRRGAVVRFNDGFEVVYTSNFLAHEIYLMACRGFVPSYDDFKNAIRNREMPITSGTQIEKQIKLYPSANKTCGCYLAHIIDVNGSYLRSDGSYKELSKKEISNMYPLGTVNDFLDSSDKIYHLSYSLSGEEKALIKAHFLRFLDPMNHYVTPETKHCIHKIKPWAKKRNIGEYPHLTCFIKEQYKRIFGERYENLIELSKFKEVIPSDYTGKNELGLEINFSKKDDDKSKNASTSPKTPKAPSERISLCEYIPANMKEFKNLFAKKGTANITITYKDGSTETKLWTCKQITQSSNIKGNLTSKAWYKTDKNKIEKIVCSVE